MSVIMTMMLQADPQQLEQMAGQDPQRMRSIADKAEEHGVIAHRFYGSDDGRVMVVDEWPDAESFQRFFEEMRPEIEPMMQEGGVTAQPEITFWRKLETHDEIGWEGRG